MNPNTIIDALGGTYKTAKLCEVAPGAVSQWRKHGIPKSRLMFLRLARPDVFAELEKPAVEAPPAGPSISGADLALLETRRFGVSELPALVPWPVLQPASLSAGIEDSDSPPPPVA